MGKYEHANSEIENIERKINMEYERDYDNLEKEEKNQVILDHFFHGDIKYTNSADKLRVAIQSYRTTGLDDNVKVTKITYKSGASHYQIREKNGRFGKWIRD